MKGLSMAKFEFDFYHWEKKKPNAPFLKQPFGDRWETWTWAEAGQMARKLANGIQSLGLPPKSHIGLVSKNCREWIIADLAIIMAGHVSVPFFATLTGKQIKQVLELGDVAALFVGKMEVWEDMKTGIAEDLPVIAFPHYEGNSKIDRGYQWHDFINKFDPIEKVAEQDLSDIWTIVFTSGTTGSPKGVVLDYQILQDSKAPTEIRNDLKIDFEGNNRFFSYLPLNHIGERVVVEMTTLKYGGCISFSESIDTFGKNLAETRPTAFFGVPRIFTKFQQGILAKMPQKKLDTLLKIPIVSGIIKKKLQKALGIYDARTVICGAAPLPEALKQWYRKIGVPIANGYGMTENCAVCTILLPEHSKPGSVGKPQPEVELKIAEGSGEILMRGPYVMKGYYNAPEKTAEIIKDGWLHTGDQGYIDEQGDLYITGRVKDTFKTAKGKYIVPAPIESGFSSCTDIEQICLLGLGCPQPIAMVNISESAKTKPQDDLIKNLSNTLESVNKDLPNYQKISKIVITKDEWSVENGLITPTLKVKRNVMNAKFESRLQGWYEQQENILYEE